MRSKIGICAVLAVAAAAAAFYGLTPAGDTPPVFSAEVQTAEAAPLTVVVTPAEMRTFEALIRAHGTVEARETIMVAPKLPGTLTQVFVDEGDPVVAGETVLLETDPEKLERALDVARQDVALAKCGQADAAANLASTQAQLEKAELDHGRFTRLREKDAVTEDALEQQASRLKVLRAGLSHAQTTIVLAKEQHAKAQAALAIAEKNLADARVTAPITGVVSRRMADPGEFGDPGKDALILEDVSSVDVSVFVPAEYYTQVRTGETEMRVRVAGVDAGMHAVTFRAPVIEPRLRTFEVQCRIENPPEGVAPGALAEADILLEQRTALGVPSPSIETRGGRTVVFVVENQRARLVPVTGGLSENGWTEVAQGELSEGATVVSMGQFLLNDGSPVVVQPESTGEKS